jgi:hypothetical protein
MCKVNSHDAPGPLTVLAEAGAEPGAGESAPEAARGHRKDHLRFGSQGHQPRPFAPQ